MKKLLRVSPALVVFSPAAFAALDPPATPAPAPAPAFAPPPPALAATYSPHHDSASGGDVSLGIFDRPPEQKSSILFEQPPAVKLDTFSHNWFVSRAICIALQPCAFPAAVLCMFALDLL